MDTNHHGMALLIRVVDDCEEISMRSVILWSGFLVLVVGASAAVFLGGKAVVKPEEPAVTKRGGDEGVATPAKPAATEPVVAPADGMAMATFGAGCFWCTEAVFQRLKGVQSVVSGYSGGSVKNPTYEQVCTGTTGHAEAIQVTYDPKVISFDELLEVFWKTHDPTTKDQQGNDYGTQYRSAIFYHTDEQKLLAEHYKQKLDAAALFPAPIVTEITKYTVFYPAEAYHQNYFNRRSNAPYCRAIILPKLDKLREVFSEKLKDSAAR
jgi:peptide-methionine (S)-S-oxide reductase